MLPVVAATSWQFDPVVSNATKGGQPPFVIPGVYGTNPRFDHSKFPLQIAGDSTFCYKEMKNERSKYQS